MFIIPNIFKKKKVFIWSPVIGIVIIAIGFAAFVLINTPQPNEDMKLGVTFSINYAEETLHLDWKKVYLDILNDLEVKYIRLPIYWDRIEPSPGEFDFSELEFMLDQAEQFDAKVIAVVGRRQPRWPECHVPAWAQGTSESVQQNNALTSIRVTVERFMDKPAIIAWQVENEPLLSVFGTCPRPDMDFLRAQVDLVKTLDPKHPVMITESGELSTWLRTIPLADWIGVSMYRTTWNKNFGYWYYPLSPKFYRNKAVVIRQLVDKIIISELQAEPWFRQFIYHIPLEEQYKSMNPEILKTNIDFARQTGFDEAYLWGVEWWYWMKEEKGESEMWDTAREVLRSPKNQ